MGRDMSILRSSRVVSISIIFVSATKTMESFHYCYMNVNFAEMVNI